MSVLRLRSLAERRLRCLLLLISEVQVAQINGEGNEVLYHSNGILSVDRKVTEAQQTSQQTAFPEPNGNHASLCSLGSDALKDESECEDETA